MPVSLDVPSEILAAVQQASDDIDAALADGVCPSCRRHGIQGSQDSRQSGHKPAGTVWWHYRCPHCHYVIDATRPEAQA